MIMPFGIIAYYQSTERKKEYLLKALRGRPLSAKNENKCQYIVTLTSYGKRIKSTAPYTICSLLNQTVLPDRIILWLAEGTVIPPILKDLTKKGVEIKFCEDLKSYKKLIPALKQFPDDVLITADDDVYYPENWFEQLKNAYSNDNTKIYAHRMHEISFDEQKNMMPYRKWRHAATRGRGVLFPTGIGGILYPPRSLDEDCCKIEEFMNLAPHGDDIWFWAMAKLKGTEYGLVNNGCTYFADIAPFNDGLFMKNVKEGNDRQIKNVINRFPEILKKI
jgi:hypothetical protein